MNIEIERLYWDVNEEELKAKILSMGGKVVKEKTLFKRLVKSLPLKGDIHSWVRLRDEGDKVVMTLKQRTDDESYSKEFEVKVSDFENTKIILEALGTEFNSYQENYRETFEFNNCEVAIDIWPFLEPVCEIEGQSEESVLETARLLELDSDKSFNKNITSVYHMKYGEWLTKLPLERQKNFYFGAKNPFLD